MAWPHRRLRSRAGGSSKTNSGSSSNSKTSSSYGGSNTNSYRGYSSRYHSHHVYSRGSDETAPTCGYYGPQSENTTSPLIPLGVCGNYRVGDVDKSMLYECDSDVLTKKIYNGQWCSDLDITSTIASDSHSCTGGTCYGNLVFSTESICHNASDYNAETEPSCACNESSVQILNTGVCITQEHLQSSFMVECESSYGYFKYYQDTQCQDIRSNATTHYYEGCNAQNTQKYEVQFCSGAMRGLNA
eukprot:339392_1